MPESASASPSVSPSASPSESPSISPSRSPSASPSASPSSSPSLSPSESPSSSPSVSPSASPSPVPASQLIYTLHDRYRLGKLRFNFFNIAFGSGNEKYPQHGVPLDNTQMGIGANPFAVIILDNNADGFLYKWDRTYNTIRVFYPTSVTGGPHAGDEFSKNVTTMTSVSLEVLVIGK